MSNGIPQGVIQTRNNSRFEAVKTALDQLHPKVSESFLTWLDGAIRDHVKNKEEERAILTEIRTVFPAGVKIVSIPGKQIPQKK